jgi:hypothetical protein
MDIIPELKNRCDKPRTPTRLPCQHIPSNEGGIPYRYLDAVLYRIHASFADHFHLDPSLEHERLEDSVL